MKSVILGPKNYSEKFFSIEMSFFLCYEKKLHLPIVPLRQQQENLRRPESRLSLCKLEGRQFAESRNEERFGGLGKVNNRVSKHCFI